MIFNLIKKLQITISREIHLLYNKLKDEWGIILLPYGWLLFFFFIPFLLILKTSFSETVIASPPIADLANWVSDFTLHIRLNLENYYVIVTDTFYVSAFLSSTKIALFSTLGCLLLGYPMAYSISRMQVSYRPYLLLLIALPFWTSFLIRVYAWMSMLSTRGLINVVLEKLHIISAPLSLLDNVYAVCIGIVYCYLPFMIFPIYASLSKINDVYIESAFDLGCPPWRAFLQVTMPLSMPGVMAGSILVFIPAIGEFVIPELLGGPDTLMIGRVLWWEFFNNRNWPLACTLAAIMVLLFVIPVMVFQKQKLQNNLQNN